MVRRISKWLGTALAPRAFVVLHLLLLAALFAQHGIADDKEALKYLGCAQAVLQGDLTDLLGNYLKYGAYVLFLLPFVAVGLPQLAVLAQVALGLWAAHALGRLVERITGQAAVGHLAMGLLLLCIPVQTWTLALYTEAFFTSMSILFVERITRPGRPDAGTIALALITVFARPVGMLFVGPAVLWKAAQHPSFARLKPLLPLGYAAVLLVAISLPGIRAPQLEPIVDAHVIAGMAEDPGAMAEFEGSSILAAQVFLLKRHGVGDWLWLTTRRIASLYTLPRGYFSTTHNLLNGVWMLLYPLALAGLWCFRNQPVVRSIAVMLFLHTLLVGLTHDEWSGRFMVPLMPWVILLAVMPWGTSKNLASASSALCADPPGACLSSGHTSLLLSWILRFSIRSSSRLVWPNDRHACHPFEVLRSTPWRRPWPGSADRSHTAWQVRSLWGRPFIPSITIPYP